MPYGHDLDKGVLRVALGVPEGSKNSSRTSTRRWTLKGVSTALRGSRVALQDVKETLEGLLVIWGSLRG